MQKKHPQAIINEMFDHEAFQQTGYALIELLSKYFATNIEGNRQVILWKDPVDEDLNWQAPLPRSATLNAKNLLLKLGNEILPNTLAIHHPHNIGHQVATPLPIAALCDLVASLTNQAMTIYEAGPSATMLERQVIRWLCDLINPNNKKAGGILTSGGALANLTALLAARQVASVKFSKPWNAWKTGLNNNPLLCILASEHAHYSISRAAGIMGLGSDAVIKIKADSNGRMCIESLKQAHENCKEQNLTIIAVVANAGCTATGSIDPLEDVGEYCQSHDLWFHVDGAHGASALLSDQHAPKLAGIHLADSVIWDGHKLLYMPATISAVLFKNAHHADAAFSQEASYLFQEEDSDDITLEIRPETFNISYRTLECTKRMMGLKLWTAFSLYGTDGLGTLVDEAFSKAQLLATKIKQFPNIELLMEPETNIVCFRYKSDELNTAEMNLKQTTIRKQLLKSGDFYLTQVELHGKVWLRTTLMNPFTTPEDLNALLIAITES